jgi:non-canonical poly(A) RNA polymerase PAPD5/7
MRPTLINQNTNPVGLKFKYHCLSERREPEGISEQAPIDPPHALLSPVMSAGPSKPSEPRRSRRSGDSSTKRKKRKSAVDVDDTPQSSAAPAVSFGEDFIGFAASEEDEPTKEQPKSTREWDVGKPSASTSEKSGRENDRRRGRESERDRDRDYGREDGYASKKQRVDAASRRALWVENIEWEDCMNIAEMCVSLLRYFPFNL